MFRGLGQGGNVLATVFEMLFMQTLSDFNGSRVPGMEGVYAISATHEDNSLFNRTFSNANKKNFFVPRDYVKGTYNVSQYGPAYCEVERSGSIQYNLTVGAGVTLIIWDNDGSFCSNEDWAWTKGLDWTRFSIISSKRKRSIWDRKKGGIK